MSLLLLQTFAHPLLSVVFLAYCFLLLGYVLFVLLQLMCSMWARWLFDKLCLGILLDVLLGFGLGVLLDLFDGLDLGTYGREQVEEGCGVAAGCMLEEVDYRLEEAGCRLETAGCRLAAVGCRLELGSWADRALRRLVFACVQQPLLASASRSL